MQLKHSIPPIDSLPTKFYDENTEVFKTNTNILDSNLDLIEDDLKNEPKRKNSDSLVFIDPNELHSQEETTEIASSNKPDNNKAFLDYKSLVSSFNSISQVFQSHVSLVQSEFFIEQMKSLKADNEKLKSESKFYSEKVQNLLIENIKLKNDHSRMLNSQNFKEICMSPAKSDLPPKNSLESASAVISLSQQLTLAQETMAKQENDILALRFELEQLNELKKKHEELNSENLKARTNKGISIVRFKVSVATM